MKSQPTHDDNFSHEGKKGGKVGLAYRIKTIFLKKYENGATKKLKKLDLQNDLGLDFLDL